MIDDYLDPSGATWTQVEADAFAKATELWSEVADIRFRRTYDPAQTDFTESLYYDSGSPGHLGSHEHYIGDGETIFDVEIGRWGALEGRYNRAGHGWDEGDANGGLIRGGLEFTTILHEIGHGIGLDHSHADHSDDPQTFPGVWADASAPGDNGLNSELYTLMSYRDGPDLRPTYSGSVHNWGKAGGPMAFDIAAIQDLCGANTATRAGDDVYTLPSGTGPGVYWTAIWDTGGNDSIVHDRAEGAVIDLRTATLQNAHAGGGYVSRVGDTCGGSTVAEGDIIENATGGGGGDTLRGNGAQNHLNGSGDADTLVGAGGNDILEGGAGDDIIFALSKAEFSNYEWFDPFPSMALRSLPRFETITEPVSNDDPAGDDGLFV